VRGCLGFLGYVIIGIVGLIVIITAPVLALYAAAAYLIVTAARSRGAR
jgi:hypothetical protein